MRLYERRGVFVVNFLTVEEVAERLGLSVATVRRRAATGVIPARKSGKQWLIEEANLPTVQTPRDRRYVPAPPRVDIPTALRHVRETDLSDLWVPDILRYEDQFSANDQLIDAATAKFYNDPPEPSLEVDVSKTSFFTRSAILISLEDRIAYQAAVGAIARQTEALLPESVFSARLSTSHRWFFKQGTKMWLAWHKQVRKELKNGYPWMIKTDLVSYFDHIPHQLMLDEVSSLNPDPRVPETLRRMFSMWAIVPGIGIPQGPNASRLLGNLYLLPVDRAMIDAGYHYLRYMDDIRIVGKSKTEVIAGMRLLERECRRRGLAVSAAKTKLLHGQPAIEDEQRADRDQAQYFLDSDQLPKARRELKAILNKALASDGNLDASAARFSLYRLARIREHTILQSVLTHLDDLAPAASVVAAYLRHFITRETVVKGIDAFLSDPDRSYSTYLVTWLFAAMIEAPARLPDRWTRHGERYCKDRNQPSYLRAIAASVLARSGRPADINWIRSEITRERDPTMLRGYAVALHWVGALDAAARAVLVARSASLVPTVDYLAGRRNLPSLLDRDRSIWLP
jgi:excisionase family DNA binding protein